VIVYTGVLDWVIPIDKMHHIGSSCVYFKGLYRIHWDYRTSILSIISRLIPHVTRIQHWFNIIALAGWQPITVGHDKFVRNNSSIMRQDYPLAQIAIENSMLNVDLSIYTMSVVLASYTKNPISAIDGSTF
jgi:hypothetical protein